MSRASWNRWGKVQRAAWIYIKAGAAFLLLLFMLLVLIALMGAFVPLHGQIVSVKDFPGSTVGDKLINAQNLGCSPDTAVTCVLVLDPVLSVFSTGTLPARCSRCTWLDYRSAGSISLSGLAVSRLASVRIAETFSGSDCGQKIAAAFNDLGGVPGEVWISQACGVGSSAGGWSAFSVPDNSCIRFVQGGTYWLSGTITLGFNSCISGLPMADHPGVGYGPVILKEANSRNLSSMISVPLTAGTIRDIALEGNKSNNSSAGPNILVTGVRARIINVNSRDGNGPCLQIGNGTTGVPDPGSGSKIFGSHFRECNASGVYLNKTVDIFISGENELQANGRYGLEGIAASVRVHGADISGNVLGGILGSGSSSYQSNDWQIQGVRFANNLGADVDIESASGGNYANTWTVVGNTFRGLGTSAASNTYSAVKSNGGGAHVIASNIVVSSTPSYKYCVEIAEPSPAQELADVVVSNQCAGSFGTSFLAVLANTAYCSNVLGTQIGECYLLRPDSKPFAALGSPANGTIRYCSDCNATCTSGGGTGRICFRENGAWTH